MTYSATLIGRLLGFAVAASPLLVMQSAKAARFLDRPEGRIAYDDTGAGPLVVLVPGLGDVRAEYRFLAPQLVAAGYRVVTTDLRGHGESSVTWSDYSSSALGSDIVALVRHLDAGPAYLVGTSMGAGAVAWAAADAPDAVRGLVLIGPFVREVPPASKIGAAAQKLMMRVAFATPWSATLWGKAYESFYAAVPEDFTSYRAGLVANLKEPGRIDALEGMMMASKKDVEARLADVRTKVLVVMGTNDPDFADPRVEADTVAGLLGGRVHMVQGAGHYPQVEAPATVGPAIAAFLGEERS